VLEPSVYGRRSRGTVLLQMGAVPGRRISLYHSCFSTRGGLPVIVYQAGSFWGVERDGGGRQPRNGLTASGTNRGDVPSGERSELENYHMTDERGSAPVSWGGPQGAPRPTDIAFLQSLRAGGGPGSSCIILEGGRLTITKGKAVQGRCGKVSRRC